MMQPPLRHVRSIMPTAKQFNDTKVTAVLDTNPTPSPWPTKTTMLIFCGALIFFGATCFLAGMAVGAYTYQRGFQHGQQESMAEIRALSAKPGLPVQLKQ